MKAIVIGGLVWVALWFVPLDPQLGIGTIEKLFLVGPLVVIPLGARGASALPGALLVAASFFCERGWGAALLCGPWAALMGWWAVGALRSWRWEPGVVCRKFALLMLPVGAMGLVQSRAGLQPLGFREPLVLLVAVHFHFAAFVSPLMAAEIVGHRWWLVGLVCLGSPVLAAGYVLHLPVLRLAGALMLVVGLVVVSVLTAVELPHVRSRFAQRLLAVAALSVWYAMAYAAVYAVADFFGEVWVAIPQMARTHGVVNALGFSVAGLLGWRLERNSL